MAYTTIDNPELYFQVKTYSGSGSDVTISLDGEEDMQPDLVWIKRRNSSINHKIYDAVRGAGTSLSSNNTAAEVSNDGEGYMSAFTSNGFTVIDGGTSDEYVNQSGGTYIAWCWKAGTTSGISGGSVTPTGYSFNTTSGFSIIGWDGAGATSTIPHGLGAVPHFIIIKRRNATAAWQVYHPAMGNANKMWLNETSAMASSGWMSSTSPTSSVFTVIDDSDINESGGTHVAYCFAPKQGFSKFGSYVGTGADDGPFVFTGFRPAMVIYKRTGGTESWMIQDNRRPGYNPMGGNLFPSLTNTESTDARFDFLSNGFKARSGNQNNDESAPHIYAAFAEAPFVNSNGVPCNAR